MTARTNPSMPARSLRPCALLLLALTACSTSRSPSSPAREEARPAERFSEIEAGGAFVLDVKVGPAPSVKLTAPANVLPHVKTTVEHDRLRLALDGTIHDVNGELRASITLPSLTALDLSGASAATVHGVSGARLRLSVSGASHATLDGDVQQVDADLSGASKLDGPRAQKLMLSASGASSAHLTVTGDLAVDLSGASHATVSGKPHIVNRETSGASSLELP